MNVPPLADLLVRHETPADDAAVEALYASAFGPGRHARTAYRLRAASTADPRVSFVALRHGTLVGAIRQTEAQLGGEPAYLLGPLAVAETAAKQGIGRRLLALSIAAAEGLGARAIVLIGDLPFYAAAGFARAPAGSITIDGPVEAHRLLVLAKPPVPGGALVVGPFSSKGSACMDEA